MCCQEEGEEPFWYLNLAATSDLNTSCYVLSVSFLSMSDVCQLSSRITVYVRLSDVWYVKQEFN